MPLVIIQPNSRGRENAGFSRAKIHAYFHHPRFHLYQEIVSGASSQEKQAMWPVGFEMKGENRGTGGILQRNADVAFPIERC
nr:hypothetical protein BaRGS_010842 [Batillaria attramentaria]